MEAVPVVGPTLGAIPAGLIMLSVNPTGALWVVLATVIIQLCENYLLVPRVMGRKTGVHPLLCLLAIIAFGTLFGLLGVLLAIPITVMVKLVIEFFVLGNGAAPAHAGARDHTALLRYEARTVAAAGRRLWQSGDDADARAASEEIEALAEELDGIIERRRGAA